MTHLFIIYLVTNKINNKKYIGQTIVSLKKRWQRHCWTCTLQAKRQAITEAIAKYGKESFQIFEIDYADSLEEANRKEVYWGLFYNSLSPNGYNLKLGGRKYAKMAQETKDKISKSNKGKIISKETRKKSSLSHKGFKPSQETREKLSIINKGKKPHENTVRAASQKSSKKYLMISPDGEEIIIINMRAFCRENNLSLQMMTKVCSKKVASHKGWKHIKTLNRMNEELGSRRKPLK